MRYKALLFDLDGTLVDTIALYERAVIAAFAEAEAVIPPAQFRQWYMGAWHLQDMLAHFGMSEDDAPRMRARRDEIYENLLRRETTWLPGGRELLKGLEGKTPLGVVTGSWMSYVDAIDTKLDAKRFFRAIVTADDMQKFMKPHPHGLLIACDRLGLGMEPMEPADCLYVGDQAFDVEAAHAAGMQCVIVRGTYTPETALERADCVVDTLGELPSVLASV